MLELIIILPERVSGGLFQDLTIAQSNAIDALRGRVAEIFKSIYNDPKINGFLNKGFSVQWLEGNVNRGTPLVYSGQYGFSVLPVILILKGGVLIGKFIGEGEITQNRSFAVSLIYNHLTKLGCTDTFASNYDSSALTEDGSCVYETDQNNQNVITTQQTANASLSAPVLLIGLMALLFMKLKQE